MITLEALVINPISPILQYCFLGPGRRRGGAGGHRSGGADGAAARRMAFRGASYKGSFKGSFKGLPIRGSSDRGF